MTEPKSQVRLQYLEEMTGGSPDLVREMIDIFITQIPEFIADMKALYEKKDWNSLGMLAHKAKSSVAIMGMEKQASELKTLELLTREGSQPEEYLGYIRRFESCSLQAIEELKSVKENL